MKSRGGLRLFARFLFRLFDFGFFGFVDVDALGVDVDGEFVFRFLGFVGEEVFENDREADSDEEGGEDNFPGDVPAEDVLGGKEEDGAEGEHEEVGEFAVFIGEEADEAWDDDEESPPAVKEQFEAEQAESFAAEEQAKC